jgi:hypothetical protein
MPMSVKEAQPPITPEQIENGDLPPALDSRSPPASSVIAHMEEYIRRWNAKDAHALWNRIYRLGQGHQLSSMVNSEADVAALLEATEKEGWGHSKMESIKVYPYGAGAYLARIGYSRFRPDGSPMLPVNRLSAYVVTEFPDGLRITGFPIGDRPIRTLD